MIDDVPTRMATILRRLRGLKATRPVYVYQANKLSEEWSFPLTLAKLGDPGYRATYRVTIECGGDPVVDVGYDGFHVGGGGIIPGGFEWDISGNTATCDVSVLNSSLAGPDSITLIVRAWALNGLSASIVRTV